MDTNIHIIRWEELPDFSLYIDQVVAIVEKTLYFLNPKQDEKILTKTMINNYVKAKIVNPPVKKKYTREQVAYFIVICILKKVYSLDSISKLFRLQIMKRNIAESYNLFCDAFEYSIKNPNTQYKGTDHELFSLVISSVVDTLKVEWMIMDEPTLQEANTHKK